MLLFINLNFLQQQIFTSDFPCCYLLISKSQFSAETNSVFVKYYVSQVCQNTKRGNRFKVGLLLLSN